jgi:hypothetical protein
MLSRRRRCRRRPAPVQAPAKNVQGSDTVTDGSSPSTTSKTTANSARTAGASMLATALLLAAAMLA